MLSSLFSDANQKKFERSQRAQSFEKKIEKKARKNDENDDEDREGDALSSLEIARLKPRKERKPKKEASDTDIVESSSGNGAETTTSSSSSSSSSSSDSEKNERTIFVGNVPTSATSKSLILFFKEYGAVESLRLRSVPLEGTAIDDHGNQDLVKRISAQKRKFGDQKSSQNAYIVFQNAISAKDALEANNRMIDGRHLRVDKLAATHFDPSKTVYLGGLSKFVDEEKLREMFASVLPNGQNDIANIRLIRDSETLYGKGFGYLMLTDRDAVMKALTCHGKKFKSREIRVTVCGKRTKRDNVPKVNAAAVTDNDDDDDDNNYDGGNSNVAKSVTKITTKKEIKSNNKDISRKDSSDSLNMATLGAAARRVKAKMAKAISVAKRIKDQGKNKNKQSGKKMGGVLKKVLKAAGGKTGGKRV
jgi:RNA recognition motif-containing protein